MTNSVNDPPSNKVDGGFWPTKKPHAASQKHFSNKNIQTY